MAIVSRETQCSTQFAAQIQQRRDGLRKKVRHGGALCCTCLDVPPPRNGRDCDNCHAEAQKAYRKRKKAREATDASLAADAKT